jgi:CCR4-NOT complex subunit CAF16
LGWLKKETEKRACTIVYATHILDNLASWPTHLVHMSLGRVKDRGEAENFGVGRDSGGKGAGSQTGNSVLGELVLGWLREDLKERGPRNGVGSEGRSYVIGGVGGYGQEHKK